MKKALVTGGAGFIGSHLCDRLVEEGYFVYCMDNLYTGYLDNVKKNKDNPNFVFINCEVSQSSDLEVDEIYNLACPASPAHYQRNPIFTIETSVKGAIKMGQLAQKLKSKLFQASTSEVYGDATTSPQNESYWGYVNPIGPRSCYDESKRLAESILFVLYSQNPFPLKVARIFNTYGPRMHPEDGRAVSTFITQALTKQKLTVFGSGEQTRSFCYIDDLIDAIRKFMNTKETITGPINLGNDNERSIKEIAELILKMTKSNSTVSYFPLPQDDPTHRKPNIDLAKELLNWEPKTTLETGLRKTIEYYIDYYKGNP